MKSAPRARAAAKAERLFSLYEAAFPEKNLRREWKHVTLHERDQWLAVGDAVAQDVFPWTIWERDADRELRRARRLLRNG